MIEFVLACLAGVVGGLAVQYFANWGLFVKVNRLEFETKDYLASLEKSILSMKRQAANERTQEVIQTKKQTSVDAQVGMLNAAMAAANMPMDDPEVVAAQAEAIEMLSAGSDIREIAAALIGKHPLLAAKYGAKLKEALFKQSKPADANVAPEIPLYG